MRADRRYSDPCGHARAIEAWLALDASRRESRFIAAYLAEYGVASDSSEDKWRLEREAKAAFATGESRQRSAVEELW